MGKEFSEHLIIWRFNLENEKAPPGSPDEALSLLSNYFFITYAATTLIVTLAVTAL